MLQLKRDLSLSFSFHETLEGFYSTMEVSHLLPIWQMIIASSFIRAVFAEEPDKSDFQGKLTTPGNSVLKRLSFSNSDEFPQLKSGSRGSVMFPAKHGFRKSQGRLGNFQYEGKMIGLEKKNSRIPVQ